MMANKIPMLLVLEDGTVFRGRSCGARVEQTGEVVFNTSMSGYQEILTDPSYRGQIVVMTYPLIGNYGINKEDNESRGTFLEGFVVREMSPIASNFRATETLPEYLQRSGVPCIEGIDTRKLTKRVRAGGSMRAILSTEDLDVESRREKVQRAPKLDGRDLASDVSCGEAYTWKESFGAFQEGAKLERQERIPIVAYDFGIKYNILRGLTHEGFDVTVVPAQTTAEEVLALGPRGVFLSNGPGDPAACIHAHHAIRQLSDRVPIFGICLGHQIMAHVFGGSTFKMKFGHHGGNQPVKDLTTGSIEITSQNHSFAVDPDSLPDELEVTHINLNDRTVEGLRHKDLPIFSVQYHPEACPGPHDAAHLFTRFRDLVDNKGRETPVPALG